MPAPPLAARSGWSRRAVLACAVVVLGLGSLDLYQHYRLSAGASVLVCLSRPLAGWWLELAAAVLTALAAQPVSTAEPWPWPITSVFALVVVLVIVGLRAPRRVLVELWLLLALLRAAACLAVPDRRDWRGLLTMVVVSAIALLLADAWRERNETGRRLTEQEQISQAERTRRVVLEERTRIARELHDVVAHHMSVIAIQAEAAPSVSPTHPASSPAASPPSAATRCRRWPSCAGSWACCAPNATTTRLHHSPPWTGSASWSRACAAQAWPSRRRWRERPVRCRRVWRCRPTGLCRRR